MVLLTAMNLRGIRESGTFFAVPTYRFMVAILGMCGIGMLPGGSTATRCPRSRARTYEIEKSPGYEGTLTTIALIFLLARAFSSGCAALTGVEAISNGVPAFRKPKSKNAATTLLLLGMIAITMMLSIITLAREMGLRYVDPHELDRSDDRRQPLSTTSTSTRSSPRSPERCSTTSRRASTSWSSMTGIILVLAANTAFNGFPVLGSILAQDGLAPRALGSRGDRLAYSNGIVFLAVMAIVLIIAFDAEVTRLIQLYIVGVFVSFNLSQLGMIRHWTRHLATERDPAARRRMQRSRLINTIGLVVHRRSSWSSCWSPSSWPAPGSPSSRWSSSSCSCRRSASTTTWSSDELAADDQDKVLPTRVHAIVLVSKLHKPTLRALAFAKATRPNVLEAVYVGIDPESTDRLLEEWDDRGIDVPLKVLHSPYREIIRPIVDYAVEIRKANPRGVVAVYIPEYVVGRWWEQLLHNQTALRLKGRLLFTPGVMVTSVPYQLPLVRGGAGAGSRRRMSGIACR